MTTCKTVTIFEGPDGGGKSTAAAAYAEQTGAKLVHCGPYPQVTPKGLGRMYLEAMMPALEGYQDVVLDRCWLSEPIYGQVFRYGQDRLGTAGRRVLERVALRCGATVVLCLPAVDVCLANWRQRHAKGEEYLTLEEQLAKVWDRYYDGFIMSTLTALPVTRLDYTDEQRRPTYDCRLGSEHEVTSPSSGSLNAKVLIVGEELAQHTDFDSRTLYPFCGLGPAGCSRWLAQQLWESGVKEVDLLWTNVKMPGARQVVETYLGDGGKPVVALGDVAAKQLDTWDVPAEVVNHPAWWKRFRGQEARFGKYPLIKLLKELIK